MSVSLTDISAVSKQCKTSVGAPERSYENACVPSHTWVRHMSGGLSKTAKLTGVSMTACSSMAEKAGCVQLYLEAPIMIPTSIDFCSLFRSEGVFPSDI